MKTKRLTPTIALLLLAGAAALAGPLNPPAGPVTSSYKTLTDVEPRIALNAANTPGDSNAIYVISQPGSYYLTGNLSVPVSMNGIRIACNSVTIDLNGFQIHGDNGSSSGVALAAFYDGIAVKNGSVEHLGSCGLDLSMAWGARVSNVMANQNGTGIKVLDGVVDGCTATWNSADGFVATSAYGTFTHCTATYNTSHGFSSTGGSLFENCTANENQGQGFTVGQDSTVRNCIAVRNVQQGIVATLRSVIVDNQVHWNGNSTLAGIWMMDDHNDCEGNDVTANGYGIYAGGATNTIVRNRVGANTTNFYIVAGNHVGAIVTMSTNAALISGSTGGGLGTTDPLANLVY
jgi:hypothetical protein